MVLAAFSDLGVAQEQDADIARSAVLELSFIPAPRAQIAIWIEHGGEFMATVRLTEAVASRGIGNRPGASEMNSGFRWPYGRREGVLPVWAAARASQPGARLWKRVIFQDRRSEGAASRTSALPDSTVDNYYCLSFNKTRTRRDTLDAVSCPSVFSSDKGRYITPQDVAAGYGEPYETPISLQASMRPLGLESLYPPRRDVIACTNCPDHADAATLKAHANEVMPDLDAVSMATPQGGDREHIDFPIPQQWPGGQYSVCLEINVEGDYNDAFGPTTHPTPALNQGWWDDYAHDWGYPYRGQPSVVYCADFELGSEVEQQVAVSEPVGTSGGWDVAAPTFGELGSMTGMTDDPTGAPGSGVDRLSLMDKGDRMVVSVHPPLNCDGNMVPSTVTALAVARHDDELRAHEYAMLSFEAAGDDHAVRRYDVRVSLEPITDEASFMAGMPARQATLDAPALYVPTDAPQGQPIEVAIGGLAQESHYYIGVRALDACAEAGPIATAELTTPKRVFATVSPCFVATAAYGTPMADEIGSLRRFRDRELRSNAVGRALVSAYEHVGPALADFIRSDEDRRAAARALLQPIVELVREAP